MSWCLPGAGFLSKALCSILLALIVLQYMFGSVGNFNRRWDTLFYTRDSEIYSEHLGTKHRGPFLDILLSSNNSISTYYPTVYFDGNSTVPFTNTTTSDNITTAIPICPPVPPNLGKFIKWNISPVVQDFPGKMFFEIYLENENIKICLYLGKDGKVEVRKSPVPSVAELEKKFNWLQPGGHYSPTTCQSQNRIAIIVPYRARAEHLLLFLQHMHPFLRKQQIEYTIFIIEQNGDGPFNRAMLMNVGFKEALKIRKFDCFIFHDVDLLPEDDRNLYTCPEQPRHMSVAVDIFKYKLPYTSIFGGVSALTTEQFYTVNGFSNSFWGWGGEDDDMSNRVKFHHFHISRYPVNIARYTMLTHHKEKANPKRYENLQQGKKKYHSDGLVNLKYAVVESRANLLYTWFLVNLRKPS